MLPQPDEGVAGTATGLPHNRSPGSDQETDDFYRSSNGDRWRLVLDIATGHRTVQHESNLSSEGRVTETPVEEWLDRTGASPENAALRALLEQSDAVSRTE